MSLTALEEKDPKSLVLGSDHGKELSYSFGNQNLGSEAMNFNVIASNSDSKYLNNLQWDRGPYQSLHKKGQSKSFTMEDGADASTEPQTSKRSHPCTWPGCGKLFLRKTDVTRHLRIHLNERPFVCEWPNCGKSFMQRSAMKIHYRTHTGEKPNKCPFEGCGKAFNDSSSLARHRRTHCFDEPFPCSYRPCQELFKTRKLLVEHERSFHNAPVPARKNSKASAITFMNLPTPTATPDSTPSRSERTEPPFIFHPNFNNIQSFKNGGKFEKEGYSSLDMNNLSRPSTGSPKGRPLDQVNQRSTVPVNDHTQLPISYPSAFHEAFLSQKQCSVPLIFDPNNVEQSPAFFTNQPLSSAHPSVNYVNQLPDGSISFPVSNTNGQFYHSAPSVHMGNQSGSLIVNSNIRQYHRQQPSHPNLEKYSESFTSSDSSSMNAYLAANSLPLKSYSKVQEFTPFPSFLRAKTRPPRIQTDIPFENQRPSSFNLDNEENLVKEPQTAREDRRNEFTGNNTVFSPLLFPPRTTDGFMGFNGFNFQV